MFDVAESEILGREVGDPPSNGEGGADLVLAYNHTEPSAPEEGVDRIEVTAAAPDEFRVDYRGDRSGQIRVTREGANALVESALDTHLAVPQWVVVQPRRAADLPPWVPDGVEPNPRITCERCRRSVVATDVVTPRRFDGATLCQGCWDELRGEQ